MIQVPDGWEASEVGKLIKVTTGNKDTVNADPDGIYPFVIRSQELLKISTYSFDGEAILIAGDGDIRNIFHYFNGKFDFHQRVYCLHSFKKNLNGKYFYYFFRHNFVNQVNQYSAKGTVDSVRLEMITKMPMNVPPIKEQEKIAKILSTLDNAIESTHRIIEKEKNIKTALMQELLTNGIDKNGQIRTPQTHTYKQSELGLIPDEWEVMSLIDVTDKNNRYSFTGGPFGSDLKSSDYVERGVRVIQLQNIGDGEFKNNDFVYTLEQKAQELFSCQIFPNEIIMSKMGDPVGRACLIPNLEEKFIMCSDGIRIKVDLNKFDNYFIFLAINNTSFRNLIERVALGSTRKRIGLIELKTLKLKLPEFEEQKQIAKILTTQDKRIEMEETNLSKFKELKKGLMNDLLSGVVRVKV